MEIEAFDTTTLPMDVREPISKLRTGILDALPENVVGVYLFGSLTYDAFDPKRSDIDLLVVVESPLSEGELDRVEAMHQRMRIAFPTWRERIEISYTPFALFAEKEPPVAPRPYTGEGRFWQDAPYGNEWIINNYLLQEHGIVLYGAPFASFCPPIAIEQVQEAARRDLVLEWQPKLDDLSWLANPHNQSYLVMNLCRILYTVEAADADSKVVACAWVRRAFPHWASLIASAEAWRYGDVFPYTDETRAFLRAVIDRVGNMGAPEH